MDKQALAHAQQRLCGFVVGKIYNYNKLLQWDNTCFPGLSGIVYANLTFSCISWTVFERE